MPIDFRGSPTLYDTFSSRPAPGVLRNGALYLAKDTGQVFRTDQQAWTDLTSFFGTSGADGIVYNVKSFGAKGNGVANDTAVIQQVLDLAAITGGIVYFPAGIYQTTLLTIYDNIALYGAGMRATILRGIANTAIVQTQNFAALTGTNSVGGVKNFAICNMTIDGNKGLFPASIGLQVYGYGYVLDRLRVANCGGDDFYSEWSTAAGSPGTDSMEAQIVNCKFHDSGANNVNFKGPHDSQWLNTVSYLAAARGFWIQAGGGSQFANCHSWGNSQTHAWQLDDTCYLSNCEGEGASVDQLWIRANDCSIIGGNWFGAGAAVPVGIQIGDAGVLVSGTLVKTKIVNCTSGAFKLTNEATSMLEALVYQTAGPVFASNNPAVGSSYQISVSGMAWTAPAASFASGVQVGRGAGAGATIWGGTGAPAAGLGANGDSYFRTDTPAVANQRIYIKSAGAWVGVV